jgi:hypothetical protein
MDCEIEQGRTLHCKYPQYQGKALPLQTDTPTFQYAQLAENSLEFAPLQIKNGHIYAQLPSTLSG